MARPGDISRHCLETLVAGKDLSRDETRQFMAAVMDGGVPTDRLADILTALRAKGETVDEIVGFASVMRENAVPVTCARPDLVDTCGTGGDGTGTFNISTATALTAAAMGIPVAKHGNRAVSSNCGSADVLEALGLPLDLDPEAAGRLIETVGIGFLFAPALHPAMKHAAAARKKLGVRTVFNLLGPLTNPAGAQLQLLGVFDPELCIPLAEALAELGSRQAYVVHGAGGLDEVSLLGETRIAALKDGRVSSFSFHPEEAGLTPCRPEELTGGNATEGAEIVRAVLAGEPGPKMDVVVLNAAFVAVLAGKAGDFKEGAALARQALTGGKGIALLDDLVAAGRAARKEPT